MGVCVSVCACQCVCVSLSVYVCVSVRVCVCMWGGGDFHGYIVLSNQSAALVRQLEAERRISSNYCMVDLGISL